jgi:hypothetical protein
MTVPNHPSIDDCLFHYTTAGGLKGILENKCIWASDSAFLNDSSEIRYAGWAVEGHLKNMIEEIKLSNPAPDSQEQKRLNVIGQAKEALANFNRVEEYTGSAPYIVDGATYVSCFTANPDQLSQWRGYGGQGYSVGFTRDSLNKLIVEGDPRPVVGKVIQVGYGQPAVNELFREIYDFFKNYPDPPFLLPSATGLITTVSAILPQLAKVKHDAFKEEQEWRVVVSRYASGPASTLYFREGPRLIPYLKLRFNPSDVAFVYIGPGGDFHDKRALRAFLMANGYDVNRVWIEHSSAPFRGG